MQTRSGETTGLMRRNPVRAAVAALLIMWGIPAFAQLVDQTQAPNVPKVGITKSLAEEVGAGRGTTWTPNSSLFIINRDPFRAIRRGRQLFQRKFTHEQGAGPGVGDGSGDMNTTAAIGAGLSDSCAGCHGRPRGSAGAGGDVATRPDSRDAPHLFGLGLKEILADEITADLREIRRQAINAAVDSGRAVTRSLTSKGISYGSITARPDRTVDTTGVNGVDPDLRVRPFFAQGGTISIREFVVGAFHAEMGLEASSDPDLLTAAAGGRVVTPSGMVLDGSLDKIEAPPAPDQYHGNEIDPALIDYMEFYLLNYFKPALYKRTAATEGGRWLFQRSGCTSCHIADLWINHDRRVADVETVYDEARGILNRLFATATAMSAEKSDGGYPSLKLAAGRRFLVRNIFTDFKRHDLGPNYCERNYDGTIQSQFLTRPLWGVGSTSPYGHDGRSVNLKEAILRHGGEARASRDAFAGLGPFNQSLVEEFLNSLVLFPPDDTASNLDPGDHGSPNFPQAGHGSIKLTVLFNDPADPE